MDLYLISGATGMTGNELARQLIKIGNKVIGFDNFFASSVCTIEDIAENDRFSFYEYDIRNLENMQCLKELILSVRGQYDRLVYINCAAIVHTEHFYHVNNTFDTNVLGMKLFLNQAIEVGADIFINCSTSEVYSMSSWTKGGVTESDYVVMTTAEHSQRTSYATGKLLTEFFLKDAVEQGEIKGCSIRFANVYSKNELYPKHIIPHILHQLDTKKQVELLENSKINRRTFLHNEDSCSAVISLINIETSLDGSIYNVGTNEEVSIMDLVQLCSKKLGIKAPKIIFNGYRESDPERRLLCTHKIRNKTGWEPRITLETGIEMCVKEMRK